MNPTAQLIEPEIRDLLAARSYRDLRDALANVPAVDLADVIGSMDPGDAAIAFRLLRREHAGDVLAELDADRQEQLVGDLSSAALRAFEEMSADDRVELLDELPTDLARKLIASLGPQDRRHTQMILGYPAESVGRLMTPDYVRVRPEWTVQRVLEHIRKYGRDAETIDWLYIIDERGRLIDDIDLRTVLLAEQDARVASLMDNAFIALNARDDREEAVRVMTRYDRTALPVVNAEGSLLGIVTIDDVADVAEEEATEDIQKLAGMEALDQPYMQTGLTEMLKKRGSILSVLLLAQTLTIAVLGLFETQLERVEALVLFIPLIIACGGNTGTQAASLLIRALAIGELAPADWRRIIRREILTGVVLGSLLGCIATGAVLVWTTILGVDTVSPLLIGATVGGAVLGIVLWGVTLGAAFPLLLERLGLDPATISSPLVATLMDVSGLVIYLGIAMVTLGHVMHG